MVLLFQGILDEGVMNKPEYSHEQDVEEVADFEENLGDGDGESQDLSDDNENEGLILNTACCWYATTS